MNESVILAILIVIIFIFLFNLNKIEKYNGALTQLYAKGPMDTYLSGDAWKYLYYPYYYSPNYPYRSIRHKYRWGNFRPYRYKYRSSFPYSYPYGYPYGYPWNIPTRLPRRSHSW